MYIYSHGCIFYVYLGILVKTLNTNPPNRIQDSVNAGCRVASNQVIEYIVDEIKFTE